MEYEKDPEKTQSMLPDEIAQYYLQGKEAGRLSNSFGVLEYVRTQEILLRYLPKPPATVLDVGGGPGTYAVWLAGLGYEVHLVDPLPLHLEQARQVSQNQPEHPIISISQGDARKLHQNDHSVDVLLLFGPLYHLTDKDDRLTALREARRVLRTGGIAFVVGISRFASTLDGLMCNYLDDPEFERIARQDLKNGQHRNPSAKQHYFTTAFFHHPEELRSEVEAIGLQVINLLTIEGCAAFLQDLEDRWNDPRRQAQLLDVLRRFEAEPSVLGITGHLMAVARR